MANPTETVETLPATRAEKSCWALNDAMQPAYMVSMVSEIDATPLERLRNHAKANGFAPPSYTAIIMKAVARLMTQNPAANRAVLGLPFFKKLVQFKHVDISVAVEKSLPFLPGAAYAPHMQNTDEMSLQEITEELQRLAKCTEETHEGFAQFMKVLRYVPRPFASWLINLPNWFASLWPKFRGCAAWVNSPAKAGADLVTTTWPWPLTFSFGIVKKRPWVEGDAIVARSTIPLLMVFDRRVMAGGPASRLFADFQVMLSNAMELFGHEFDRAEAPAHAPIPPYVPTEIGHGPSAPSTAS